jgi:murein DD-endopeptidase MepM/ murein hydrolase activator NlpD
MGATLSSLKSGMLNMSKIKELGGIVVGGTLDYFTDAMPTTTTTLSGTKDALNDVMRMTSRYSSNDNRLRRQPIFRSILGWFTGSTSQFSSESENLSWDISVDNEAKAEISKTQISESKENAKIISRNIIETAQKTVEANIASTANIIEKMDAHTAIVKVRLDDANETLKEILKVVTRNTAAILESSYAYNSRHEDAQSEVVKKFSISNYKKLISRNIKNSDIATAAAALETVLSMPGTGRETFTQILTAGLDMSNTFFPTKTGTKIKNFKENLKAVDKAVSEVILGSLIRLGEQQYSDGLMMPIIGKIFGIDPRRKEVSTHKSSLEVKDVSYDTVSREAIITAIPGYLRQILMQLGGPDTTYDYRSRSWRSKASIEREFRDRVSAKGSLFNASDSIINTLGLGQDSQVLFDLMINNLSSAQYSPINRKNVSNFKDLKATEKYVMDLLKGLDYSKGDQAKAKEFAKRLGNLSALDQTRLLNQAALFNVERSERGDSFVEEARLFHDDLSFITDSPEHDRKHIASRYRSDSNVKPAPTRLSLVGINYTNAALYEIYKRLNQGINVFKVGEDNSQKSRFIAHKKDYLPSPGNWKDKELRKPAVAGSLLGNVTSSSSGSPSANEPNELTQEFDKDGNPISKGQRFVNWGKRSGSKFISAMFSGSSKEVQDSIKGMFADIAEVGKESAKKGLSKLNSSFGNVSGYLKHKLFGSAYSYNETETEVGPNGETTTKLVPVNIKANEKGGIFGYVTENVKGMFSGSGKYVKKWFNDVVGFFDYGDPKEKKSVKGKRSRLLQTSLGAFMGAGIIGGPLAIITGALTANALSFTDFGSKIKNWLFGKEDPEDNKRKGGILRKALNTIVDPIRYQMEKTLHNMGNTLKRNILGPLSDIGFAIKERVSNAAASAAKSVFSKLFTPLLKLGGGLLKGLGKGLGWAFPLLAGGYGEIKRQTFNAPTRAIGAGLRGIARFIGGEAAADELNARKEEREKGIEDDDKESLLYEYNPDGTKKKFWQKGADGKRGFGKHFRQWQARLEEKRNGKTKTMADHMAEETAKNTETMAEKTETIAQNTESVKDILNEEREKGSSFLTHDKGIHKRLDDLIAHFTGRVPTGSTTTTNKASSDDLFVNSVVSGMGPVAVGDGSVSGEEEAKTNDILNEASKKDPNANKVKDKFKQLVKIQRKNKKEGLDKEQSIWSKLLGGLGSILGQWKSIAGLIGVSLLLFNDKTREFIGNLTSNLFEGAKNFVRNIKDGRDPNALMNVGLSAVDMKVNSKMDFLTGKRYHTQTDAAGNNITNYAATNAYRQYMLEDFKRNAWNNAYGTDFEEVGYKQRIRMENAREARGNDLAKQADRQQAKLDRLEKMSEKYEGNQRAQEKINRRKAKIEKKINKLTGKIGANNAPTFLESHQFVNRTANIGASMAVGKAVGSGTRMLLGGAARTFGLNEDYVDMAGNLGEAVGTAYGTVTASMDIGLAGKAKQTLIRLLDTLLTKLSKYPKFAAAAGNLSNLFNSLKTSVSKIGGKLLEKLTTKFSIESSKTVAAVASLGTIPVALGAAGFINGAYTAENLFQIPPNTADPLMKMIAGVLGGGLWAIPWIGLIEIVDIILMPVFGKSLRGVVAELLYKGLGGGEELAEKQGALKQHVSSYNQRFGTSLDTTAYNDMTNRGMLSQIGTGGTVTNETGEAVFDDAGKVVTSGGLKRVLGFGTQAYARDAQGNVLRDKNGEPIMARDQYGNKIFAEQRDEHGNIIEGTSDKGWMNSVGSGIKSMAEFFVGKVKFQTNEQGHMIYDPDTGKPIPMDYEHGIFGRIGTAAGGMAKGVGKWFAGRGEYFKSLFTATPAYADDMVPVYDPETGKLMINGEIHDRGLLGRVGDTFANAAKGVGSFFIGKAKNFWNWLKGDDTDVEITDENGRKISDTAPDLLSKLGSTFSKTLNKINEGVDSWLKEGYELDENGDYIRDSEGNRIPKGGIGSSIKRTLQKLTRAGYDAPDTANRQMGRGGPEETTPTQTTEEKKPEIPAIVNSPKGNPLSKPYRISSYFGPRTSPYTGVHKGIDLTPKDRSGSANVGATADGTVTQVVTNVPDSHTGIENVTSREGGNYVWYKTDDGTVIKNMHLKAGSIPARMRRGAKVKAGEFIGKMGSTGKSSGPHLHYQIDTPSGKPINPIYSLTGDVNKVEGYSTSDLYGAAENGYQSSSVSGSENSGKGFLATLFEKIASIGRNFLSRVTGGLIGSSSDSEQENGAVYNQGPTDPKATDVSTETSGVSNTFKSDDKDAVAGIYNKLIDSGYSPETAAGIIGNLQTESGGNINPAAYNPNDGGDQSYGIAQWRSNRGRKMISSVPNWQSNLDGQVKHLLEDLEDKHGWDFGPRVSGRVGIANLHARKTEGVPGGLSEFKTLTDHDRATRLFDGAYEVSNTKYLKTRIKYATDVLKRFKKEQDGHNIASDIKDPEVRQQVTDDLLGNNRFTISDAMNNVINPTIPINVQRKYGGAGGPSDGAGGIDDFFKPIINSAIGSIGDIKNPKDIGSRLLSTGINMANSTLSNAISKSGLPGPLKSGLRNINFTSQSNDIGKKLMSSGVGMAKDLIRDNINLPGPITDIITNNLETPEKIFDSSNMESLLQAVLVELKQITGNTNTSNQYLNGINQKEFKDTGLRESISSLKNIRKPAKSLPINSGNTRLIQGIIKP